MSSYYNKNTSFIIIILLIIIYIWHLFGESNNRELGNDSLLKSHLDGPLPQSHPYGENTNRDLKTDALLKSRLDGPLPQDHPFLIKFIKEELLSLPSSKESRKNFSKEILNPFRKEIPSGSQFGQAEAVLKTLNGLKDGFFIECGANDGVSFSNTLLLELKQNWTGLLIEADPNVYKKLKSLKRHVYSINSCLSTSSYPEKLSFRIYTERGLMNGLVQGRGGPFDKYLKIKDTITAQCFPLYSILLAIGNPTVHYFSLDVEGADFQVLKTIPWDKVDIKVLTVEYDKSDTKGIKALMKANNYELHATLKNDFLFVKKGFNVTKLQSNRNKQE